MKKLSKNKVTVISILVFIVICGIVLGGIAVFENSRLNKAYVNEYIQEYDAAEHKTDADLFVADDTFIFNSDDKQTFTDVGEYDCLITVSNSKFIIVKSKTVSVKYIIKDTTKPVFAEDAPTEIKTYKDCEIENAEEQFTATDLQDVIVTFEDGEVDYTTVGEYTAIVYAADESDNIAKKEVTIKVIEPTITLNKESISLTVGDTETLKATVKGKDQNVTWTSSDESIATVENGVVTAKKAGTATVEAEANGVKAACSVTVNSTNNSSKSTTSSSSNSSTTKSSSKSSGSGGSSSISSTTTSSPNCTSNSNHSLPVGNVGKWFSSKSEFVAYYKNVVNSWNSKCENGEITYEEYCALCPYGYECYSCSYCGKNTGNFKYR